MDPEQTLERPLSGPAKALLLVRATSAIFLFYVWVLFSVLVLLVLVAWEVVIGIFVLRFVGFSIFLLRFVETQVRLVRIFISSLPMRKPVELRLLLKQPDAPRLFDMLETLCRQLELAPPETVFLEMHLNAWVNLKGYRRGTGRTVLGIGYDLLAALSEDEVEAALAHEMAHAKLIQRGFSRWLRTGQQRIVTLARALYAEVEAQRAKGPILARWFLHWADWFARLVSRLVQTYCRQEEFAADRRAAEICSAAAVRTGLIKSAALNAKIARIPWRERVAQLQLGEGFSQWLVGELSLTDLSQPPGTTEELFDKYSTHPRLLDRLAALPDEAVLGRSSAEQKPGLALLADPDALAERLISGIERTLAAEEDKDTRELRRWRRKLGAGTKSSPLQLLVIIVGMAGALVLLFSLAVEGKVALGVFLFLAMLAVCILVSRLGGYRDRIQLPVPDFAVLQEAIVIGMANPPVSEDAQKQLESDLKARLANEKKRRKKAALLAAESFEALSRCDYLKAHVAARLCLNYAPKSVEGALGMAVAASALRQYPQMTNALAFLRRTTGMRSLSTAWGAGWALYLCGSWREAEAFLDHAHALRPDEPTFPILLALAQCRRGKLRSAIVNARQGCTPEPRNKEYAGVLIHLLLDAGHLREAQERLSTLNPEVVAGDAGLMLAAARLGLMERKLDAADEWAERLKRSTAGPHVLVQLGEIYEGARRDGNATALFNQALESAFYPEALMGLARIEAAHQQPAEAQRHLLEALNTKKPVGDKGIGPLPLFYRIVAQFHALQEPQQNCKAWITKFRQGRCPAALANISLVVCARDREEAGKHVSMIVRAMDPEAAALSPESIGWEEAPREQQPAGPTNPGIAGVIS